MQIKHSELVLQEFNTWSLDLFQLSKNDVFFFDIETTGFASINSVVYLIGCSYYDNGWKIVQWIAQHPTEENLIIEKFLEFISKFTHCISFNGQGFDIPYLTTKLTLYNLKNPFDTIQIIDLYKKFRSYKHIFKISNLKQKTLESFLSIARNDKISGKEMIEEYYQYLRTPNPAILDTLLLHNHDDIKGMISLVPLLSYIHFFSGDFTVSGVQIAYADSSENSIYDEVIIELETTIPFPKRVSYGLESFYFTGHNKTAKLKIRLYTGELKYFYPNYKDYYYLPLEDTSIHKSVAFYVDKDYRTKAKAATCYSKRTGRFLPQKEEIVSPYFKIDYFDEDLYFELTDDYLENPNELKAYIIHILRFFLKHKPK